MAYPGVRSNGRKLFWETPSGFARFADSCVVGGRHPKANGDVSGTSIYTTRASSSSQQEVVSMRKLIPGVGSLLGSVLRSVPFVGSILGGLVA